MITNTDELKYVREQLVHVEPALAALRRDILPVSQEWYDLMAEGYIEQILRLREETDSHESSNIQVSP